MLVGGLEPGGQIPPHPERRAVYHALEGEGVFHLDGEALPFRAGAVVVAPLGSTRGIDAVTRAGVPGGEDRRAARRRRLTRPAAPRPVPPTRRQLQSTRPSRHTAARSQLPNKGPDDVRSGARSRARRAEPLPGGVPPEPDRQRRGLAGGGRAESRDREARSRTAAASWGQSLTATTTTAWYRRAGTSPRAPRAASSMRTACAPSAVSRSWSRPQTARSGSSPSLVGSRGRRATRSSGPAPGRPIVTGAS